jgi:hypothetical protein
MDIVCNIYGEKGNAYTDLVGISEGKGTLRRPAKRWQSY